MIWVSINETGDAQQRTAASVTRSVMPRAMVRWHATAMRVLAAHTPVDGLCRVCGVAGPCVTRLRADAALVRTTTWSWPGRCWRRGDGGVGVVAAPFGRGGSSV